MCDRLRSRIVEAKETTDDGPAMMTPTVTINGTAAEIGGQTSTITVNLRENHGNSNQSRIVIMVFTIESDDYCFEACQNHQENISLPWEQRIL